MHKVQARVWYCIKTVIYAFTSHMTIFPDDNEKPEIHHATILVPRPLSALRENSCTAGIRAFQPDDGEPPPVPAAVLANPVLYCHLVAKLRQRSIIVAAAAFTTTRAARSCGSFRTLRYCPNTLAALFISYGPGAWECSFIA